MFIRKYIEFFSGFFILRAWDGSGNFTRTNGTQSGAVTWADADAAGNDITTSQHDTHDEDLADGIGVCLTKNNESKPTATFAPNVDASYDLGSTLLRWKDLFISGDIAIGGGDLTSAATTFNLLATPTTVNAFAGASVALNIGHASAAAAFAGGISIPTGKSVTGAGTATVTGFTSVSATTGTFTNVGGTLSTATQNSVTTMTGLVTVGALNSGSITSGFGSIDIGADSLTAGAISGTTGTLTSLELQGTLTLYTTGTTTPARGSLYANATNTILDTTGDRTLIKVGTVTIGDFASTGLSVNGTLGVTGALTTNGGLQTFGANDSGGSGYRLVRVPNV